jgi:hypothetical protein
MAARSWMALAMLLALAGSAVAESDTGRRLLRKKKAKTAPTALVTVSNCLQLKTEVDSFAKLAVANNKAVKQSKKAKKNKKRALKNVIRKTIVLACGSTFECTDASAPAEKQDITLKMMGAGELTIRAADGCATGDARPRLFGGRDTYPSEIFYVGAVNPNNAADKGDVAFLVLQNIIVDGAVTRDGSTTPENLRAGLYSVRAGGVTLENVDFVNTQAKSSYGGGAIYVEDAPLTFTGGKVQGAISAGNGGAIWAETSTGGDALVIKDVTFTGNNARHGAGTIAFTKSGSAAAKATISAVFSGNKAAKCAVLFTDRSDVARSQKSKADDKAGDALVVDFAGSTFTDNVAENKLSFCGAAVEPFAPASLTGAPGSSSGKVGSYNDYAM